MPGPAEDQERTSVWRVRAWRGRRFDTIMPREAVERLLFSVSLP